MVEKDDALVNYWRLTLGYLLAEKGQLQDGIRLFETVAAKDQLGPSDYRALANWYLAVNQQQKHEKALTSVFKMTEDESH